MALKYDENTKLIGGFSISKVYLGRTRFPYCLHHDYDDSLGWVSEATITDFLEKPKVKIPKFVADWIEKYKKQGKTLYMAMDAIHYSTHPCSGWFKVNQELFARAWLDGYEVEKEKRYKVKFMNLMTSDGKEQLLTHDIPKRKVFASRHRMNLKQTFTKGELVSLGFEGVFDNEMFEVEEVQSER